MDFSLVSLIEDCVKKCNLNVSDLRDIAFAICMSGKISESNNSYIDLDKFCVGDNELGWNDVLNHLGITPINSSKTLPKVDKLRVISDVLTIRLSDKFDNLKLMQNSSYNVATKLGVHSGHIDLGSEDDCIKNLTIIYEALKDTESFEEDKEIVEILDMLEEMNVVLSSNKKVKIPQDYITTEYRKKYFSSCGKERFIKRTFIQEVNCILLSYLIKMDETKWISLYDIFDTIADYMNHEKIVCCVTQDIRSSLSKCHRLNNSILLVGKYSYSVYDYRFTKILLVSMYSRNLIEALNKYITK